MLAGVKTGHAHITEMLPNNTFGTRGHTEICCYVMAVHQVPLREVIKTLLFIQWIINDNKTVITSILSSYKSVNREIQSRIQSKSDTSTVSSTSMYKCIKFNILLPEVISSDAFLFQSIFYNFCTFYFEEKYLLHTKKILHSKAYYPFIPVHFIH